MMRVTQIQAWLPGIVEKHLIGHAAKRREGALHAFKPILLPLAREGPHVDAAGIA